MTHLFLICEHITCRHQKRVAFDDLKMSDDTLFPDIAKSRKFRCGKCGRRRIETFPNWSTVKAHGRP